MSYMTVTIETESFKVAMKSAQPVESERWDDPIDIHGIACTTVAAIRAAGCTYPLGNTFAECLIYQLYQQGVMTIPKDDAEATAYRAMLARCEREALHHAGPQTSWERPTVPKQGRGRFE